MQLMREIFRYLAAASVPRIETENLTRQWRVSYEKLMQLLDAMEKTGLVMIVPEYGDRKEKFSRSRILLGNPSMYTALGGCEGNMRESLTAPAFRSAGMEIFASQKEEAGDFVAIGREGRPVTLEAGGRQKSAKESDYAVRDLSTIHRDTRSRYGCWR